MATKLYDCLVATSKYQDHSGQEKRKWENVGAIWQDKDNNGNIYEYLMLKRCFRGSLHNLHSLCNKVEICDILTIDSDDSGLIS